MNQQWPHVAVVILNWNGRHFLDQFLPSVLATTYPNFSVVMADNASTDDSIAFTAANFPSVIIVKNSHNGGFAKGYNEALQHVKADYYVLLNSDVEVTPGWLTPIIVLMEADAAIGACQPKIRSWHQKDRFEYAGACGGFIDRYTYPFARGRILDDCETDTGQYEDARPVFWASGAALFIRARLYHEVGGLYEYFFAHQEEIDLCWRLQRAGYTIYVCPQSVVYHVGGGTLPNNSPRKLLLNFRNNLVMMRRNLHPAERYGKLFIRLCLDGVAGARFLFKGEFKNMWAIFKAHGQFYYWCWKEYKKLPLPYKKLSALQGVSRKILVWQFFIKKKRRFDEMM